MGENNISISNGVKWIGLMQAAKIIFQLIAVVTLARILPPSDYGLMAIISAVTAFAMVFRDMGLAAAIIHSEKLSDKLISSVFWLNMLVGVLISIFLWMMAPIISGLMSEPRLTTLLPIIAPLFVFSASSMVFQALLERKLKFKEIAAVEISSSIVALILAIYLAWSGFGVKALIGQVLCSSIVSALMFSYIVKRRPKLQFSIQELKRIYKYSLNIFIFNFVNYIQRNTDTVLIGRFIGSVDLGYYSIAYKLLLFPLQSITETISRASFPVYSRNNNNLSLVGKHYLETLGLIAFITAPLMSLTVVLSDDIIVTLLGENWSESAVILAWLAPVGFFQSIVSTSGGLLNSIGRSDVLRNLGFVGVPFLTMGIVIGLKWGVVGVATGYCIVNFFWIYPVMSRVLSLLSYPFISLIPFITKPVILAVPTSVIIEILYSILLDDLNLSFLKLILVSLMTLLIYFALYFIFDKKFIIRLLRPIAEKYRMFRLFL